MVTAELHWDPFDRPCTRIPTGCGDVFATRASVYHNQQYGFYALSRFADVMEKRR